MEKALQDGIALVRGGDIENAMELFLRIIEEDDSHATAYYWISNCHMLNGHTDEAKRVLRIVVEKGDDELRGMAIKCLKTIRYNGWVNFLLFDAPLLYLLFASVFGYVVSFAFIRSGIDSIFFQWLGRISIYGLLPLFFLWCFFIVVYFVGRLALDKRFHGKLALFSRWLIALCLLLFFPVNVLSHYSIFVSVFAMILNVFLVSFFLGRVFDWVGQRMTGESNPVVLAFLQQLDGNSMAFEDLIDAEDKIAGSQLK